MRAGASFGSHPWELTSPTSTQAQNDMTGTKSLRVVGFSCIYEISINDEDSYVCVFLVQVITATRPFLVHYSYNGHEKLQQSNPGTTHA